MIYEPLFTTLSSQQYYSQLALNFQAGAHLRVTSASGRTPVMDRVGGRDRKPVTTQSRPVITLQEQVTLVAYCMFIDKMTWLWNHHNYTLHVCRFGMFSVVLRLLHDSECQSGVHTEWGPSPESHTPLVIPLLPDSVSDNHNIDGHISLIPIPITSQIFVLIQRRIFKVWIAQCSPIAPVSLPRSSLPNPTLSPSSFLLS